MLDISRTTQLTVRCRSTSISGSIDFESTQFFGKFFLGHSAVGKELSDSCAEISRLRGGGAHGGLAVRRD